jgi:hypothetical protein
MAIISRGFSGQRSAADVKLPPGQYLTADFPVLSAGPTPHVSLEKATRLGACSGTASARCWSRTARSLALSPGAICCRGVDPLRIADEKTRDHEVNLRHADISAPC